MRSRDVVPIGFTTKWRRRAVTFGVLTLVAGVGASVSATVPAQADPASPQTAFLGLLPGLGIWGDATADAASTTASGTYSAAADPGSLYTIERAIGARSVWTQQDSSRRQITGQGVGVALLDSGVSPVPGLDAASKLVDGPDLSIESNGPLTDVDTFGHGTHMAGIIGAHDAGANLNSAAAIANLSPSVQLGVAPDSTLEALKLANTDGSTDVSQVIAALDWVTQHQTLPNGNKIRVVNLSFGTDSVQAYQSDPLAAAAENAWKHGLVVVVSGGNEGPDAHRLTDPAMDPYVLSVGASDSADTVSGWSHPSVASYSSSGTSQRHVDLVAPGRSITSLRDPGSTVDLAHPEGLVAGDSSGRLFRGSGTSQAAAVVSGSVALLLQAYPNLTPDQVKQILMQTATPVNGPVTSTGAGQINVAAALNTARFTSMNPFAASWAAQNWPSSTGSGSIEAARGGNDLVDSDGNVLSGELDVQGNPWNAAQWWAASSSLTSWQGGSWNGAVWTGSGWDPNTGGYASARWSSARWSSARWSDADWDSARWSSARWSSARWSAADWDSARWSASLWN